MSLTLLRVPKNNPVKGFLGSILTPTWVLGSFSTPEDALKSLDYAQPIKKIITRFAPLGSKLTPGTLNKVKRKQKEMLWYHTCMGTLALLALGACS